VLSDLASSAYYAGGIAETAIGKSAPWFILSIMLFSYGVRLLFHGFVVLVGTLVLAGAVNTAIIGSNGVLNRVAEDGVFPNFFRLPHPKFGTSNRIINLVVPYLRPAPDPALARGL